MKKMKFKIFVSCFLVLFLGATIGIAADYPSSPINVIIPWGAGGGTELLLRVLHHLWKKSLVRGY